MREGACPVCGHTEVWRSIPHHRDRSGGSSSRQRLCAVAAVHGGLALYICPGCGHAQWFVEDDESWKADAERFVQRIRARVPGEEPTRHDVYLDECERVEMPVAHALEGVQEVGLLGRPLFLVTQVKPVKVASNVTFADAERVKQAIGLGGGWPRVEVCTEPPPRVPEPGETLYDVRVHEVDLEHAQDAALQISRLLDMEHGDAFRLVLDRGLLCRGVSREQADRIRFELEEVPGLVVAMAERGEPRAVPDRGRCALCARGVPRTETYFTRDGEVCPACYAQHYA